FFFQAEDGIRDRTVTGVQTCALPIWPDLDELHATVSDVEVEPTVEGPGRSPHRDLVEAEGPERLLDEARQGLIELSRHELSQQPRWGFGHLRGRGAGRDHLRIGNELVTEAVIAVGVRVHHRGDRSPGEV